MIAVSFLKSKYNRIDTIKAIDASIADFIHVDLMDGLYVEDKNFDLKTIMNELKDTNKYLDIHLMVKNPLNYIKELVNLKVSTITFHLDATPNIDETINFIKEHNIKVGVAINPCESVHIIDSYLDRIDYVLIMSVIPGKGGQKFMPEVLDKINYLKDKNILIGIDGGINNETIKYLQNYKIDNIISGSYVCMSDDYNKAINILKEELKK